jgi:hypothetical protein
MTLIIELGCIGIGLIWGWWIGNLSGRITRPILVMLALGIGSLLLAMGISILVGWWPLIFFFIPGCSTLILHLMWREKLINQFGPPDHS